MDGASHIDVSMMLAATKMDVVFVLGKAIESFPNGEQWAGRLILLHRA